MAGHEPLPASLRTVLVDGGGLQERFSSARVRGGKDPARELTFAVVGRR